MLNVVLFATNVPLLIATRPLDTFDELNVSFVLEVSGICIAYLDTSTVVFVNCAASDVLFAKHDSVFTIMNIDFVK